MGLVSFFKRGTKEKEETVEDESGKVDMGQIGQDTMAW